jgi:type I restriction-modification system DNA methylase subunit
VRVVLVKLFSGPLLRRKVAEGTVAREQLDKGTRIISHWDRSLAAEAGIGTTKELSAGGQFLIRIFEDCLGYSTQSAGHQQYTLTPEISIKSEDADGGLGFYGRPDERTIVVIELKDAKTSLDKKQLGRDRKETPVEQGFRYASKVDSCRWIIVSNFREIRLYSKYRSEDYFESFRLGELTDPDKFRQFYFLLGRDNLINEAGPSEVDDLLARSVELSKEISNRFYAEYSTCRQQLYADLVKVNPEFGPTILLEKTQKILDQFIFVCFCEDSATRLLPTGTVDTLIESAQRSFEDRADKLWQQCRELFRAIDQGMPSRVPPINAYNCGLFAPDEVLDSLIVRDAALKPVLDLQHYDFSSDLDVNVLGHVFERSIADVELTKAEIDGAVVDRTTSKRKKEGIFYTPEYITRYLVEQTLGEYLVEHPDRLESVKILDPACGSGAFLNQAHTFMKNAYATKRAEIEAEILANQQARFEAQGKAARRGGQVEGLFEVTEDGLQLRRDFATDWVYADDGALLRHLYGVDLNEESAEITKLSLWLKTAKATEPLRNLDTNIRAGNSLIDDPAVAGNHAFRWDEEFGDIVAAGGFDVIIGNPPWVFARSGRLGKEEKDYYHRSYDIANYQLNTYALFIEQSYRMLRPGGKLGFIIPNTWLTIISFEPLRRFLLEQTADLQIINVYGRVFDEAHVDCCLLLFTKGAPTVVSTGEMHDLKIEKFAPLAPEDLTGAGTAIINISLVKHREALDIINTINAASYPLTRYATVRTGFVAYEVGKGKPAQTKEMKDARVYHSTNREGEGWFSYLDGRDVRRYGLGWSGQFVKYGNNLAAPRARALYQTERILVRQIPSKPPYSINAAYTDTDMLLNDRNSNIVFDFTIKPQAILGVLNSRVTSYWFAYTFDKFQRDTFPQFKLAELEQFPIPRKIKDHEAELTSYVDALTDCGNARAEALLETISYLEASYGLDEQDITIALTGNDWHLLNSKLQAVPVAEREQIYTYCTARQAEIVAAQRTIDELDEKVDALAFAMFGLDENQKRVILDWPGEAAPGRSRR